MYPNPLCKIFTENPAPLFTNSNEQLPSETGLVPACKTYVLLISYPLGLFVIVALSI